MASASFLHDISSLTFIGFMIGQVGSGCLSDRFGRRPIILTSAIMIPCILFISPYLQDYFLAYIIARIAVPVFTGYNACR